MRLVTFLGLFCYTYLNLPFFVEVLSPVPEEDESFDWSRSRILHSPVFSKRMPPRPSSPLPPLIIEKEPNRHDEPEEFYKKLEKKVLRVYRRLFIEGRSDISSNGSSDNEELMDMDYITHTSFEKPITAVHDSFNGSCNGLDQILVEKNSNERSGLKRTISPDKDEETSASKSKKSKSTEINSSSSEVSPKSTTDDDEAETDSLSSNDDDTEDNNETEPAVGNDTSPADYSEEVLRVTFKADVHRDATDYEFVKPPSVVYECAENIEEEAVDDLEDISDVEAILENNTGKSDFSFLYNTDILVIAIPHSDHYLT